MIVSGNSISVYNDAWLTTLPFLVWPTYINIDSYCPDLHVSDLITEQRDWDVSKLVQLFLLILLTKL